MALNGLSPAKLDAHPVLGVDGRLVRELVTARRAHTLPVEVRADEGDEHLHGTAGTPRSAARGGQANRQVSRREAGRGTAPIPHGSNQVTRQQATPGDEQHNLSQKADSISRASRRLPRFVCRAAPRGGWVAYHDVVGGVALPDALVGPRAKEEPVPLELDVLPALGREAVGVKAVRVGEALQQTGAGERGPRTAQAQQEHHKGGSGADTRVEPAGRGGRHTAQSGGETGTTIVHRGFRERQAALPVGLLAFVMGYCGSPGVRPRRRRGRRWCPWGRCRRG
jgi:hypothetical protein